MSAVAHRDNGLTADRVELKYRIPSARAREVAEAISEHLPRHRYAGSGANRLPGARHYTTTVYLDTPDRQLYKFACENPPGLKVRAREYYDEHLSLTELVTYREALVRSSPILWIELKQSAGERNGKRRVGIPKRDVASFFDSGTISAAMLDGQRRVYRDGSEGVLDELLALCQRLDAPLRPSVLVNYRRCAWQSPDETVRVTIDCQLNFYAAHPSVFADAKSFEKQNLGKKVGSLNDCIVEIKSLGPPPEWLEATVAEYAGHTERFSKFIAASEAAIEAG